MARAFQLLSDDPATAARLLEQAGPGPVLERVRIEMWLYCLGKSRAGTSQWLRLVEEGLPDDLRAQALLGLARALLADRNEEAAVVALSWAATPEADELLLRCSDQEVRLRAAQRLVTTAPQLLHRSAPQLEAQVMAGLEPEQLLRRAAAWRAAGDTGRAISELSSQRWQGNAERRRTLELARAWAEHGAPQRALSLLPAGNRAGGSELLVRAMAYRSQAWQRFPRSTAQEPFTSCLAAARQAVTKLRDERSSQDPSAQDRGWDDGEPLHEALRLVVECGTETGSLQDALQAWWLLSAEGWQHRQRDWLGRRLGVAAADNPETVAAVAQLAAGLPDHERCLRYWSAPQGEGRRALLVDLAGVEIGDLYSQWARQELGWERPPQVVLPDAVGTTPPPQEVRWLQGWGAQNQASLQWRRLRSTRGAFPAEALTAAFFENDRGRPDLAIRWLRNVCPDLGTVGMRNVPRDLVEAYLPLRWVPELRSAAREFGLPPWLIAGLARQESLFSAHVRSRAGAVGVLQLIPSTALVHSRALGLSGQPDLTDPAINLRLGARELSRLVKEFAAVEPALASYNAGQGRVKRWWSYWPERHRFAEEIPIEETYTYVRRVTFLAEAYRLVYDPLWRKETP